MFILDRRSRVSLFYIADVLTLVDHLAYLIYFYS